ncbi:MAG: hypothetical protein RLY21_141 [Planctomycetota bacterium]|jgi:hypothetical protein
MRVSGRGAGTKGLAAGADFGGLGELMAQPPLTGV